VLIIFRLLVFPGFAFLFVCAMAFEWVDRRVIARFQERVGPPWYQPLADFIKLLAKEDVLTTGIDETLSAALPIVSLATVLTAALYVPVGGVSLASYEGDLIIVLFLLSVPAVAYFLAGWISPGVYSMLGGHRSLLQYFSYEVPFLMAVAGPAVLAGSWRIGSIVSHQAQGTWIALTQPVGFLLALIARSPRYPKGQVGGRRWVANGIQRAEDGTLESGDGYANCDRDFPAGEPVCGGEPFL
jgi:NADH-quinone oxidoreductase subunit H